MPDRFAYPVLVLVAAAMIALGLVWPQGQGAISPAPFGHPLGPLDQNITVNGRPVGAIRGAEAPDPAIAFGALQAKSKTKP